ncbi:MAG: S1 RNA-binding domain-containing protein [Clostridia bacterium]|nr:S1 RNA-binding domain-containing protein [Clostridia bacterium]
MSVEVGDIIEGKVLNIMQYGVFVQLDEETKGLIHISEVSNKFVSDINTVLKKGQVVKVKVISNEKGKIALSIKQLEPKENNTNFKEKRFNNKREHHNNYNRESREDTQPKTFEDILSKFLKDSEERQVDIKRNFESKRGPSTKRM